MTYWEYLYIVAYKNDVRQINAEPAQREKDSLPAKLNELGREGWELVGVTTANEVATDWRLVFKRPR